MRERREDIPRLAETFLEVFRQHQGKPLPGFSPAALDHLIGYDWPGNVRELRNLLEYAAIISEGELIQPKHLRLRQPDEGRGKDMDQDRICLRFSFSKEEFSYTAVNQRLMTWALEQCGNNKSAAARLLKASRKLFY